MKKTVLFTVAIAACSFVFAQNNRVAKKLPFFVNEPETSSNINTPNNTTQTVTSCDSLGKAANAYGGYTRCMRSIIYADPNLNSIILTHRSNPATDFTSNSGNLMYDLSTNGGTTWTKQIGTIYTPGAELGRYPNGIIYNPTNNTNPNNAFITYHGACTNGTNWVAYCSGTAPLGTPVANQQVKLFNSGLTGLIPYVQHATQQGVSWVLDFKYDGTDYADTLYLRKGTFNNGDFDYVDQRLYAPMSVDGNGAKQVAGMTVAFSPDGQTGYIIVLGHDNYTFQPNEALYPIIWKSTDGGNTWGSPDRICLDKIDSSLFLSTGDYTTAFELDASVDNSGRLHMIMGVGASAGGFSIATAPNQWGMFHIWSTGTPGVYKSKLLSKPMTFRGSFGTTPIDEDSRPQITSSWAGDRLFFAWFDTDTNLFPGTGNTNPDMYLVGYNVTTGLYTNVINVTASTCADALTTFGYTSQWALGTGGNWTIPSAFQKLTGDDTAPVDFFYLNSVTTTDGAMTQGGPKPYLFCGPYSVNEHKNNLFTVEQNMPNPTNGNTQFEINMIQSAQVIINVTNMLGEVISTTSKELNAGKNIITLDASNYSKGVYFYTVIAGGFSVSKKMIVE